MRTECSAVTTSTEELRSLIQIEVRSAAENVRREEMKSMSRNFVDETICDVFATGYCAATEGIRKFSFLFVEKVILRTTHCGALDEILHQRFKLCARSDTFMQVLVRKVFSDLGFT